MPLKNTNLDTLITALFPGINQSSPLHQAALQSTSRDLEATLNIQATNPATPDKNGRTALDLAVTFYNHLKKEKLLNKDLQKELEEKIQLLKWPTTRAISSTCIQSIIGAQITLSLLEHLKAKQSIAALGVLASLWHTTTLTQQKSSTHDTMLTAIIVAMTRAYKDPLPSIVEALAGPSPASTYLTYITGSASMAYIIQTLLNQAGIDYGTAGRILMLALIQTATQYSYPPYSPIHPLDHLQITAAASATQQAVMLFGAHTATAISTSNPAVPTIGAFLGALSIYINLDPSKLKCSQEENSLTSWIISAFPFAIAGAYAASKINPHTLFSCLPGLLVGALASNPLLELFSHENNTDNPPLLEGPSEYSTWDYAAMAYNIATCGALLYAAFKNRDSIWNTARTLANDTYQAVAAPATAVTNACASVLDSARKGWNWLTGG